MRGLFSPCVFMSHEEDTAILRTKIVTLVDLRLVYVHIQFIYHVLNFTWNFAPCNLLY